MDYNYFELTEIINSMKCFEFEQEVIDTGFVYKLIDTSYSLLIRFDTLLLKNGYYPRYPQLEWRKNSYKGWYELIRFEDMFENVSEDRQEELLFYLDIFK